jgi:hypothetical protein
MQLFSFWSGAPLSYVERLCIASMLQAGHSLDIFTFDIELEVPQGVKRRSAAEILPRERIVLHENGSWALFTDIFRYEALLRNAGTWIDLDVLLLKSLSDFGDHIYGWQDRYVINGAVLRLPAESPCLQELAALGRADVVVGPHWRRRKKIVQKVRGMVGAHVPLHRLEWGTVGPFALTHLLGSHRLLCHSQPIDVLYPVHYDQADQTFAPDSAVVEAKLTPSTRAIHFWNDRIKTLKRQAPPKGSFVAKMCDRFGIDVVDEFASPHPSQEHL